MADELLSMLQSLLNACFEEVNVIKHSMMVKMSFAKSGIGNSDNSSADECFREPTMNFQVPLISLLPINSLGVGNVDFKFDLEVTSMSKIHQQMI